MKNTSRLAIILLITIAAFNKSNAQEKKVSTSSWPELKTFHQVIAQTFHPAEEGNFKPARERAGELHEKAVALEKSTPPADFKTPEISAAVKELTIKTLDFSNMTKRDISDEDVMKGITAVHDTFHKIVGLCSKDEHHGEERHHEGKGHDEKTKE